MNEVYKDIGTATAYAYAVDGGYTGTEEEFTELLGNIATDLEEIENLSVTVTTLPAGSQATASYSDGVLSLGIPKGDTGLTPALSIGTVTTLPPDDDATVTITGTTEAPVLNFGLVKGEKGDTGEVSQAELDAAVTDLKADFSDVNGRTLIDTTKIGEASPLVLYGYQVNSAGRIATSGKSCSTNINSDTPFWYKGSKFSAKAGYLLSYAFWRVEVTSSVATSNRIAMARDVVAGTEITVPEDCYVVVSARKADDSDLPASITAEEFLTDALNLDVFVRTVKSDFLAFRDEVLDMILYESTAVSEVAEYIKGYQVGSTGKWAQSSASCMTEVYWLKGSTFKANTGYLLSYAFWNVPVSVSPSPSTSDRFALERNVVAGRTITVPKDCYVLLSAKKSDGTDIPADTAPDTFMTSALTVDIFTHDIKGEIAGIESEIAHGRVMHDTTELYDCQRAVSRDWHFPFIDVANGMGLGNNHQIPNTASLWTTGSTDLTQKGAWMSDGVHPFKGDGVTDMYGITIAEQIAMVAPSYRNDSLPNDRNYWDSKTLLWLGTSIPAGSDPDAGQGQGSTYPQIVAQILGASVVNLARGSSCVRANSSAGNYEGFMFSHFIRSLTRMEDECDAIATDWDTIKTNILNAPSSLSASDVQTMKDLSFENLLIPYLDGTNAMPDLFVIDYGHNDVRPKGVDGKMDLWVEPTVQNISDGVLAEDEYMTDNNYANLKLAMNSDLSGITDVEAFASSVNRNCLQGALNFLIMVILSRNPYARITIVSDYN